MHDVVLARVSSVERRLPLVSTCPTSRAIHLESCVWSFCWQWRPPPQPERGERQAATRYRLHTNADIWRLAEPICLQFAQYVHEAFFLCVIKYHADSPKRVQVTGLIAWS